MAGLLMSVFDPERTLGRPRAGPEESVYLPALEAMRVFVLIILVAIAGCQPQQDLACQKSSPARMTRQATAGDLAGVKKAGRNGVTTIEFLWGPQAQADTWQTPGS